ncbi:MAG: thioesterase domain-containing protein, partial [Vicinamibacterales bacterium]
RRARADEPQAAPVISGDAPLDSVERDVAAIYARRLGRPAVDRTGHFFELGGNSLSLIELQLELESALGAHIAIRDLLYNPTVAGVAAMVRGRSELSEQRGVVHPPASERRLVPIRTAGGTRALFLVHAASGRATSNQRFLDALGSEQPVYGFQARGLVDHDTPHASIADMAAEYIALMRGVQPEGPYWLGATCAGGLIAVEMAHQLEAAGQTLGPLLLIDPWLPPREQGAIRFHAKRAFLAAATVLIRDQRFRRLLVHYLGGVDSSEQSLRVWLCFRIAAYRQQPSPYAGSVHVVGSRRGLDFFHSGRWARHLTGRVQLLEAGPGHRDVFDASNEQSVLFLRQYVAVSQAWFAENA